MWSNKNVSNLQKTYDESYLKCSTAVYYESQGDEKEAMACWRTALEQIRLNPANKRQSNYSPKSETERALLESLRELEVQCKERIELLEALRLSREDPTLQGNTTSHEAGEDLGEGRSRMSTPERGYIGDGTIPAIRYTELSKPPLPKRPSFPSRTSSEQAIVGGYCPMGSDSKSSSTTIRPPALLPYGTPSSTQKAPRQSSPDRRIMRTTLRSGKLDKSTRTSSRPVLPRQSKGPGASKAATLAWNGLGSGEGGGKGPSLDINGSSSRLSESRHSFEQGRNSSIVSPSHWDTHTRRIVVSTESPRTKTPDMVSSPESPARTSGDFATGGPSPLALGAASSALSALSLQETRSPSSSSKHDSLSRRKVKGKAKEEVLPAGNESQSSEDTVEQMAKKRGKSEWEKKKRYILRNLPSGVDEAAAKAIFNEIVVKGDEVHWSDVAGLEVAKNALREAVVYPFLRPDLFMGLREPARGMLLFGPPGTGKTMLARAVATESKSTFFSISASSLTSKYLGESEKLVRALFGLAKVMAPSIIFIDEIDSLLSQRSGSGEHEATRRIKTEFLIQWSDLQRAAAGRDSPSGTKERGDPNRVLVLAATNLPWAIDEAARRRFVRRQYIPLPEPETRSTQLKTLLGQQKHDLTDADIAELIGLTEGFSGSDITALAKDAAMGPIRSLGEALLHMTMEDIRPIKLDDFRASLGAIRPSVSREGLREYEDWASKFGERGG
ncbi:AAA-domain-containing protein [Xylariaceae sp. FL0016]|nr:AAA-domain-containing protein [Xylariaceae sp. FL0016]